MVWKELRIADGKAIADADTDESVTLPKALITSLHFRIHGTGGATSVALTYAMIANVRIDTDGKDAKPLDLSGAQINRRTGILNGIPEAVTNADGAYSQIPLSHYFGTQPRDRRLMLDLRNCNKRECKLTFDTDLVDAARFAAGAPKLTVIAVCWLGQVPPEYVGEYVGHIRQEQAFSQATGTGDLQKTDLPIHQGGKLAFLDITVSAVTTVENVELTANADSISLINEHIRDNINRLNYERHLDTALTLTGYWDFMFIDRYDSQVADLPNNDKIDSTSLIVERGSTTTTVIAVLGTVMP